MAGGSDRRRSVQGRRVTPRPRRDHYSYTRLRRSGDGAHVRRAAVRRADRRAGRRDARRGSLANFVGRFSSATILDVGTGTGRAALLLARGGARVTGVDASEEMLAVARARAADGRR